MPPLILRHGGTGDPGLHRGGAQDPIRISDPQPALVVGKTEEKLAQMSPEVVREIHRGLESGFR